MAVIYLICGKLCSGKSTVARKLSEEKQAVILSCDEVTSMLFDKDLGEKHDEMVKRIKRYLLTKAEEILHAGTDVVLEWGFWQRSERDTMRAWLAEKHLTGQWVCIRIPEEEWRRRIAARNAAPGEHDYPVDEGLFEKAASLFEEPDAEEISDWAFV